MRSLNVLLIVFSLNPISYTRLSRKILFPGHDIHICSLIPVMLFPILLRSFLLCTSLTLLSLESFTTKNKHKACVKPNIDNFD